METVPSSDSKSLDSLPPQVTAASAPEAILAAAREHPGHCTLLCLGPLTNVAEALLADPGTLQRCLSSVVVMGGAVRVPGNCGPGRRAEFNFYSDPEAARVVFGAGLPLVLLDLGVANDDACTQDDVVRLQCLKAGGPVGRVLQVMLRALGCGLDGSLTRPSVDPCSALRCVP